MIIVCTGGRDHKDVVLVDKVLDSLNPKGVIVGDCPTGVDLYVRAWCRMKGVDFTIFKADWDSFGLSAGPKRNFEMVKFGSKLGAILIAFKGNKGTADCVRVAKANKMLVLEAK